MNLGKCVAEHGDLEARVDLRQVAEVGGSGGLLDVREVVFEGLVVRFCQLFPGEQVLGEVGVGRKIGSRTALQGFVERNQRGGKGGRLFRPT